MPDLDNIDSKILIDLLKDSNKTFSEIAEEVNLTKEAVSIRYRQMVQAGIIVGSTIQMDYKRFGYKAVADIAVRVDPQQIYQVTEYIRKIPNIYSANPQDDIKYNLHVVATLRDIQELELVKDAIKNHKAVLDLKANIWTAIKNIPENLTLNDHKEKINIVSENLHTSQQLLNREKQVDEIDKKIVKELAKNSRMPLRKIAQDIGTSIDTVARRYKRLVENGIIKATIQIDLTKIGYFACVKFDLAFASQSNSLNIIEKLLEITDLTLIIRSSGDYDIRVFVQLKDLKQLLTTQKEIIKIPGIIRLDIKIAETYSPWPSPSQYISTF